MTILASDSFSYTTTGDLATVSGTWTRVGGASGAATMSGAGQLALSNSGGDALYWLYAHGSGDHYASCTVGKTSIGWIFGAVIRAADASNFIGASWGFSAGKISLYKRIGGTFTSIGTANYTPAIGDVIALTGSGSTLTIAINGTVVLTVTDSALSTNTKAGFQIHTVTAAPTISYFETGVAGASNTASGASTADEASAAGLASESIAAASTTIPDVATSAGVAGESAPAVAASVVEKPSAAGTTTESVAASSAAQVDGAIATGTGSEESPASGAATTDDVQASATADAPITGNVAESAVTADQATSAGQAGERIYVSVAAEPGIPTSEATVGEIIAASAASDAGAALSTGSQLTALVWGLPQIVILIPAEVRVRRLAREHRITPVDEGGR